MVHESCAWLAALPKCPHRAPKRTVPSHTCVTPGYGITVLKPSDKRPMLFHRFPAFPDTPARKFYRYYSIRSQVSKTLPCDVMGKARGTDGSTAVRQHIIPRFLQYTLSLKHLQAFCFFKNLKFYLKCFSCGNNIYSTIYNVIWRWLVCFVL